MSDTFPTVGGVGVMIPSGSSATDTPETYDAVDDLLQFVDAQTGGATEYIDPNPPIMDGGESHPAWYPALPQSAHARSRPIVIGASSALDQLLPVAYGKQKVRGMLYAHKSTGGAVAQVYVFCHGEQAGCDAADIMIGNQSLSEWHTAGFVSSYEIKLGAASQTQATLLGTIMAGTDVSTTTLPGYCYIAINYNRYYGGPFPSTLQPVAIVHGRKVTDFRDASTSASTNPMLIAHDIMTSREVYPGFNDLPDGTNRWDETDYAWIADRCDEILSDTTVRFEYSGLITQRDARDALREVLGHCFCDWYLLGSSVKIVADLLPEQVPGLWSATASATLTGSTGSATGHGPDSTADSSGVAVNSRLLLVSGLVATVLAVDSVSSPNTITIDQSVTISNQVVRKIAPQHIYAVEGRQGWITGPDETDVDPASAPDVVKIIYTDSETFGRASKRCEDPAGYTADSVVRTEVAFEGIRHASNAVRAGTQIRRTPKLCPFSWTGLVGPNAAGLEPGDVITFDSSRLSQQLAIVTSTTARLDNTYQVALREFDQGIYSDDVADDDTDPSGITEPTAPALPTSVAQKFVFHGDLDSYNEFDDPDDLTATGSNFSTTTCALTYDATNDWTKLVPSATFFEILSPTITWANYGSTPNRGIFVVMVKAIDLGSTTPTVTVGYRYGNATTTYPGESVSIPSNEFTTQWKMVVFVVNIDATYPNHFFYIGGSGCDAGGYPEIAIKRMFWIPAVNLPFFGVRQVFDWTEGTGASTTVTKYLSTFIDGASNDIDGPEVEQGNVVLTAPVVTGGEPVAGPSARVCYGLDVLGEWGRKTCTISTQEIVTQTGAGQIDSLANVDGSGKAVGYVATIGSDGDTMEFKAASTVFTGVTNPMSNDSPLKSDDAAGSGDIDLIKADASDDVIVGDTGNTLKLQGTTIEAPLFKVGDIAGGNYIGTDANGNIRYYGNGTYWIDVRTAPNGDGGGWFSSEPSKRKLVDDGSGSTGINVWQFSSGSDEELLVVCQIPHEYKEGTTIYPHVHWAPTDTGTGNVRWGLEYAWVNMNGTFGNSTIITSDIAASGTSKKHQKDDLPSISGTGMTISSMIMARLFREGSHSNDTYGNYAALLDFDYHVEINSPGSNVQNSKT